MIEAIVLTGGKSRRMGEDKAKLLVDGVPQAARIVQALLSDGIPVTVLGPELIVGAEFISDEEGSDGPLAALATFIPKAEFVFVASCDMPRFDVRIVRLLADRLCGALKESDFSPRWDRGELRRKVSQKTPSPNPALASVPEVDGFLQPYCAIYARRVFSDLKEKLDVVPGAFSNQHAGQCAVTWLRSLHPVVVSLKELELAGIAALMMRGANTPQELAAILKEGN